MESGYRIGELAQKTGVTKRTVHYYIGKGLIPPPEGSGVNSTYDDRHLKRIQLVKRLQERYLPLERIRDIMSGLSDEEVESRLDSSAPWDINDGKGNCRSIEYTPQEECRLLFENDSAYDTPPARGWSNASPSGAGRGKEYVRFELGPGLELHSTAQSITEYEDIIMNIRKYAKKLFEERR